MKASAFLGIVVLCGLSTIIYGQHDINTGEGRYCLFYPGGGAIESETLSKGLPRSFSFEAWVMSPTPRDGTYKTMTARFGPGPNGDFHNRWADFDFQVQASGTLNFFMGNGEGSIYGVLMGVMQFPAQRWTHVAFSIEVLDGQINPHNVIIYVDTVPMMSQGWQTGGLRQDRDGIPVMVGGYINQDNDYEGIYIHPDPNKWWRGYIDEVRYWAGVRSQEGLQKYLHRIVPVSTPGLLSYLRKNEARGNVAHDETGKYHFNFTDPDTIPLKPVWKASGAKIHVDVDVGDIPELKFKLPGISPYPPFDLSFTYNVKTLPETGELWANGQKITQVPFALRDNTITYRGPRLNRGDTTFSYFGGPPNEKEEAIVFMTVAPLPPIVDICGVVDGDNSTCTCMSIPFHGFSLNDVERVLLLWEIEQTVTVLNDIRLKIDAATKVVVSSKATDLQHILDAVNVFFDRCIRGLGGSLTRYMDQLAAL